MHARSLKAEPDLTLLFLVQPLWAANTRLIGRVADSGRLGYCCLCLNTACGCAGLHIAWHLNLGWIQIGQWIAETTPPVAAIIVADAYGKMQMGPLAKACAIRLSNHLTTRYLLTRTYTQTLHMRIK